MHNLPCLDRQAPEYPSIFRITRDWLATLMLAQVQDLGILAQVVQAQVVQAQVVLAGAGFGIGPAPGFDGHGPAR